MRPPRFFAILTLLLSFSLFAADSVPAQTNSAPTAPRIVLHDFDRDDPRNNLRGNSGTWNLEPDDQKSDASFILDDKQHRGESGHALFLTYKLNPDRASQNGFYTNLNDLDARNYDHLEIWVKGDAKIGFAKSFKIEFKKPKPGYPGQMLKGGYVIQGITSEWQKFTIPLNLITGITEWDHLDEFVISFHTRRADVKQGGYYIEDIALIKTGNPGPSANDHVDVPKKKQWENERGGEKAAIPFVQKRLVGWPTIALADKKGFPKDDREFVMRVARDTWKGIDALTDKEHGLPLDTVRFSKGSVALKDSRIGDYTNVTNIGIYLLSVVGAFELKFITKDEALQKLKATFDSLEHMESYEGFLYNYYDTTSDERSSNFVSFVDSAWLSCGLITLRHAFPELESRCTPLLNRGNYQFFYDPVEQHMNHGYYVNLKVRAEYNYGVLYTEPRAGSFMAMGKGDVPEEHWFSLLRTFPENADWQTMTPTNRVLKKVRGHEFFGGYYEWKGYKYVPCWGGSLFEALMPTMVIDERQVAPNSLGTNDVLHATIQRRYALEELKYPVWGMSPCSTTAEDNYSEFGVKVLGTAPYKPGVVTPHVSALAINFTPKESIENLRKLIELYDVYGEYGFYDAVDPMTGQVAYKYLALDQGMIFVALANYLGDHCVQKHFMADPIAQRASAIIKEENFFEPEPTPPPK